MENQTVKVTRIAEPVIRENNIIEVHYDVFVENKQIKQSMRFGRSLL